MSTAKTFEIGAIGAHFESLSDPRHPRNVKHQLDDIIVIADCAIVSHAAGPTAIHIWAKAREGWLHNFCHCRMAFSRVTASAARSSRNNPRRFKSAFNRGCLRSSATTSTVNEG